MNATSLVAVVAVALTVSSGAFAQSASGPTVQQKTAGEGNPASLQTSAGMRASADSNQLGVTNRTSGEANQVGAVNRTSGEANQIGATNRTSADAALIDKAKKE